MDVAQLLGAELTQGGQASTPQDLQTQTQEYLRRAAPC